MLHVFAISFNISINKNEQDQVYIFHDKYPESSQINQLKIMYRFEYINHVIHISCLLQNLY